MISGSAHGNSGSCIPTCMQNLYLGGSHLYEKREVTLLLKTYNSLKIKLS